MFTKVSKGTRSQFQRLLAEKLSELEPCLNPENTMEQQWTYIISVLYDAAAQSICHKSRNHKDWFDNNTDTINNLLEEKHKAHWATLDNPTYNNIRQD